MGRYLGPKCKQCRREGESLCSSVKCALLKRKYPPGIHGSKGLQDYRCTANSFREKQKAKRLYNISEKQFRSYYKKALASKEPTAEVLLRLLETRLDNVVFRMKYAQTRRQARQMVSHGFMIINQKKVDIPSYSVSQGDIVALKENKKKTKLGKEIADKQKQIDISWVHYDTEKDEARILGLPQKDDFVEKIDTKLILAFYSR